MRLRDATFIALFSGCLSWLPCFAQPAPAPANLNWEPARRADDFVDSIGVCTHWQYRNTPYGKFYEPAKQRLAESGIRHIRDGWDLREVELWRELGVRTTMLLDPGPLDKPLELWKQNLGMLDMIEGPNEPNNFWPKFNIRYKGISYPKAVKLWQDDLYQAVRSDAIFASLPVASPTPIFDGAFQMAPITSFDYLAIHPYAGGNMPSQSIAWTSSTIRNTFALVGTGNDLKQLIATESGYHYASGTKVLGGIQSGISETAGGKYFLRHFAEYWNAGFFRTITYEFLDERRDPNDPEANFGLIRNDLSPKPSFIAMRNLIAILGESRWDREKLSWIRPASASRAVALAIDGPAEVHHTVLSRADGTIDLLLWQEVPSYDLKARKDLNPNPVAVKVRLAKPAGAELYRPLEGKDPIQQWEPASVISLEVPDQVIIVRLKGLAPITGSAPATPADLKATTTATSALLSWHAGAGKAPTAYLVSRLGRYLATVQPAADGSASFTDSTLMPGYGFPYAISAVDEYGLLSSAATVVARTVNQRPDLVVQEIHWEPAQPKPGEEVRFSITIANVGNAPTPSIVHGVAIKVDDAVVCWSDNYHGPLAPKASITVTTNSGPNGKGTWTCVPGTFHIEAKVDDINRIDEQNEQNNTRRVILSTGISADLMVSKIHADEPIIAGKPCVLRGTIRNHGTAPTPAKAIISLTFVSEQDSGKPATLGFNVARQSLAPGQEVELKINWTPEKPGKYTIVGIADDIDRIAELDKSNNRSEKLIVEAK